ncbi:MAG TPA: helix-turn-helix domain-containing protein [Spirochaetia bacterium]
MASYYYRWRPYVPVAERQRQSARESKALRTRGTDVQPVVIEGRAIARTFWGKAWCDHLESYSDFANRLPRGRTYVRNGSVWHLEIAKGVVRARVQGSDTYTVTVEIDPLKPRAWAAIKEKCTGQIASLLDLLSGRISEGVMGVVTDRDHGMFPSPKEIHMSCSCPDWAVMCKHVAAALYGVGARLDERPELLFVLRGVDHEELIAAKAESAVESALARGTRRRIADADLADVFGVEIDAAETGASATAKGSGKAHGATTKPSRSGEPPSTTTRSPRPRKVSDNGRVLLPFPDVLTGKDVAALRARRGLSVAELARALEVSPAAVYTWEKSKKPLRLHIRSLMALKREWNKPSGDRSNRR